jgi:hypothetical protein
MSLIRRNGTKNAEHPALLSGPLVTAEDLLTILHLRLARKFVGNLETAAGHVSRFLGISLDQLSIDNLFELTQDFTQFKTYLRERKYKRHSIRSYCGFIKILTRKAKALGWLPRQPEVPESWTSVLAAVKPYGCTNIVKYAIRHNLTPSEFGSDELAAWEETMVSKGQSFSALHRQGSNFRSALRKCRLAHLFPRICQPSSRHRRYSVPVSDFSPSLRTEVESLLKWKQADFAPGRPRKCHHRAVTASRLESCFTRLYGFVSVVKNGTRDVAPAAAKDRITTLPALVNKANVTDWVAWRINERKNKGSGLTGDLGLLHAAMRYHPDYKTYDFKWFSELMLELPEDQESDLAESKARKYVPYDVLADIPRKLHEKRQEISTRGQRQMALLVHDEFLMRWLVTLVWRQRNIRECRIGARPELVNLFKAPLPAFATMAKPKWVEEKLTANPHEQFWQFYFRENETKNGHEVRAFLPRQLINPLEEYLAQYRPALFKGRDPGTLFINRVGGPLTSPDIRDLVSNLTFRYAQRRVTPHICRDILAYRWLDEHPEDYLTLSKILWHRDINTTLRKYGRRFDESNGVRNLEEWLGDK